MTRLLASLAFSVALSAAVYQPCMDTPTNCAANSDAYLAFFGGAPVSQPQITSEDHPCLVGFVCVMGGIPVAPWVWGTDDTPPFVEPTPPIIDVPDVPPVVITPPGEPTPPTATPEPATCVLVGATLLGVTIALVLYKTLRNLSANFTTRRKMR